MAHYAGIRDEQEEFTHQMADETWMAMEGMDMYDVPEWGPQSIRCVWFGSPLAQGLATQANSGLLSLNDLVGAQVCRTPPGTADEILWEALFAYMAVHPEFDDLSWDDLGQVPIAGYDEGINAVMQGASEVGIFTCNAGEAYEMEASPAGLYWLPIPAETADDLAAWAAFNDILPCFGPSHWESGVAGLESGGGTIDVWASYYSDYCYDFYPEPELVWWFTKQIDDTYDDWKGAYSMLEFWTPEFIWEHQISWFVPWHEGSVRYWQDIGMWDDDAQAKQDAMLAKYPQTNTRY
jgi:hypothetical protein